MKRIILHLEALAMLLPLLLVTGSSLVHQAIGLLYLVCLVFFAAPTVSGKRFIRKYYREILRLERMM